MRPLDQETTTTEELVTQFPGIGDTQAPRRATRGSTGAGQEAEEVRGKAGKSLHHGLAGRYGGEGGRQSAGWFGELEQVPAYRAVPGHG